MGTAIEATDTRGGCVQANDRLRLDRPQGDGSAVNGDAPDRRRRGVRRFPEFGRIAAVSASLVGTTAATSVLGLAYWTIAAREASVAAVGVAGAAISLMMLLGNVGMLGLGTLLIAEVPKSDPGRRRLLVRTSLLVSGGASTLLGLIAALVITVLPSNGLAQVGTPVNALDFALGTGLMGLTMVLDQAVLAIGSGGLQLERNVIASVVKIVALIGLAASNHTSGMDIFLAWTLGNLVSLPSIAHRTRGGRQLEAGHRIVDLDVLRGLARAAAGHHVLNLVLQAPIQLLSLVVVVVLSAESNGFFSTARSIAGFVFVLPFSITIGLFAAAGGDELEVIRRMRLTIPLCLGASAIAVVALFPLDHLVLSAFGSDYSSFGLDTLRVLILAGLPFVIKDHFVALRRVQGKIGQAAVVASVGAVGEVVAAILGARADGLVGLCAFWVGALVIEALLLSIPLRREIRTVLERDRTLAATAPPRTKGGVETQAVVPAPSPDAMIPAEKSSVGERHGARPRHKAARLYGISQTGAGPFLAAISLGLVLISWAVQRSRAFEPFPITEWIYWSGYLLIFLPAAAKVLSPRTRSGDRLLLSMALPLALQLSREVIYPTRFMFHDELIHANGLRLIDVTHHLFATNSLLPVTEYYPGLEIATNGLQQLTGLPEHGAALVALILARILLSGAIIAVLERATGSTRLGCVAALIYACNPQEVFFNSQFSYQTLALPLALFTVFLFTSRPTNGRFWGRLAFPVSAMAVTVVTHHLTALLLIVAFGAWWLIECLVKHGRPSDDRRSLALMTMLGSAMVLGWAFLPGNTLVGYLDNIVVSSVDGVVSLARGQTSRALFHNSSGVENPLWERVVSTAAVLLVVVALIPSLWFSRGWLRRRHALILLLIGIGASYPLIPAGHITVTTAEVTDRAAGFLFLGVGLVVALGLVGPIRNRMPLLVALPLLAVLFVGGEVFGAGTTQSQLPGRFLVSADSRSIDAPSLQAAEWLKANLPANSKVYADRVDGLLAAAVGGDHTVTHIGDNVDASRILLAPEFTNVDRSVIKSADISYVIVDERDATGLPNEQFYIESGEYGQQDRNGPVPLTALRKLASVTGVRRIFDNGDVVIYDVRALNGH